MRVLITGVTGMAGSHLAEYILSCQPGVDVFGTYRWRSKMDNLAEIIRSQRVNVIGAGGNVSSAGELAARISADTRPEMLNLILADLLDPSSVHRLVAGIRPDRIFHLAAQSFVPASWDAPAETLHLNTTAQLNVFEAIRQTGIDPLIQIAGSSEEYGLVHADEVPIKESNPLRPLSPYAVSKVTQDLLAQQYYHSYHLKAVVTRGFNHTGPRRGDVFAESTFAKQIAEIEKGLRPPVVAVGDLSSKRDWTDVRDMVRGYWLALERGIPGETYNIGSGETRAVGEMLDVLRGLSRRIIEVQVEASRLRPSDVRLLWADTTRFRAQTGWRPEIPFQQTMSDLLDYWREQV